MFKCRLCFPSFLPCQLSPLDSRLKPMSVTNLTSAVGYSLNLFQKAHGVHLCGEKKSAQNFQHLRASKHFPGVFVHLYFKFLCQNVDIVYIGSKTLLLVCHASLRFKYFKSWYWIFCLNDTKVGLILWFIFYLFVCLARFLHILTLYEIYFSCWGFFFLTYSEIRIMDCLY